MVFFQMLLELVCVTVEKVDCLAFFFFNLFGVSRMAETFPFKVLPNDIFNVLRKRFSAKRDKKQEYQYCYPCHCNAAVMI